MDVTLYHNPRCSKSRQTMELLATSDANVTVVEYLKTPPNAATLSAILAALDMSPRELMREKETVFGELQLSDPTLSDAELIAAMVANPILIERPIALANGKAAIGRPPENVMRLLEA